MNEKEMFAHPGETAELRPVSMHIHTAVPVPVVHWHMMLTIACPMLQVHPDPAAPPLSPMREIVLRLLRSEGQHSSHR